MVLFYVNVVAFLMTLLVNKLTNTIRGDCNVDEFDANNRSKAWYIMPPNFHVMKYRHKGLTFG